jgi:protein O-GlcNAc transferase
MSGQVISGSPDPAQMMQRILQEAVAHHEAGRPEQASEGYHALLRHNPDHPDALHLLGVLANEAGNFQRGAALIRRSLVLMPNFPDAHLNLGNALSGLGDLAGARAAYERAIALRPDFLIARLNLAEFLNRHGQAPAAEMHARHALQLAPGLERANLALWHALRMQRRAHEAVAVMQRVIANRPNLPALLTDLATTQAEAGDVDTALALHRQAVAMVADNPACLFANAK